MADPDYLKNLDVHKVADFYRRLGVKTKRGPANPHAGG